MNAPGQQQRLLPVHARARMAAVVGVVLAVGAWFTGPAYPRCNADEHCSSRGEVCVYGTCHGCALDSHCKDGLACVEYTCQRPPTCRSNADCTDGRVCRDGACALECNRDDECAPAPDATGNLSTRVCRENRCALVTAACATDADCAEGLSCTQGACAPRDNAAPVDDGISGGTSTPVDAPSSGADFTGDTAVCGKASRVYFDFNASSVREDAREELARIITCLKQDTALRILLQGHADERGSTEYNLALGERRALATRLYLKNAGVDPARVNIVSLGEERPLDPGSDEAAWARNRRVEILPAR